MFIADIIANMKFGSRGLFRITILILLGALVCIMSGALNLKLMCLRNTTTVVESINYRNIQLTEQEVKFLHFYTNDENGAKQLVGINPDYLKQAVYENIYRTLTESQYTDTKNKKNGGGRQSVSQVRPVSGASLFANIPGTLSGKMPSLFPRICPKEIFESCYKAYYSILNDIKIFPVLEDTANSAEVCYEDGFGDGRSYGGKRIHEGTDIMAGNNEPGYFTVVSMTDGIIEKMGWLELGGYRIGIRSPSGGYYYYAHLDSYAEGLSEGDSIKAGTKLGMMGNTGYGKEGTKGKFDVHLHMGVYYGEKELSFNPFYILKMVDGKPYIDN